jgi:hypothetical protein
VFLANSAAFLSELSGSRFYTAKIAKKIREEREKRVAGNGDTV